MTANTADCKMFQITQQVNSMLDVPSLKDETDDGLTSFKLGQVISAAAVGPGTLNGIVTINGKSLNGVELGNDMADNVAITAGDFDKFRVAVAAAISTLDKRLDAILNQSNLEC